MGRKYTDGELLEKALTIEKATIEKQMVVYAQSGKPFRPDLGMYMADSLKSPLYSLAGCVPEAVMSVLMIRNGEEFIDMFIRAKSKIFTHPNTGDRFTNGNEKLNILKYFLNK